MHFRTLSNKDNIELQEHVLHPTWPEHLDTHSNATKPQNIHTIHFYALRHQTHLPYIFGQFRTTKMTKDTTSI